MKETAHRMACLAALVAVGCSYVVTADRSKVQDNLYQPSPPVDAALETGDDGSGESAAEGGELDSGDASADDAAAGEGAAQSEGGDAREAATP